ncbi:MAG: MFS transporter [Candidatus Bathyarchaeota archaeon]|nr:MFS transporter [Candidatus Bathyarchaeota archaeon]MDH5790699.1 MFS transporter [Candidatus Bathyarchaeota archaeon]
MKGPEPTPEARRNYYILIGAMVSMQVTTSTIYMVLPLFFENHGMSKSAIGLLISVGTFAGIISSVLAGRYSDSHGRKPVLLAGVALYSLVFFLFALAGKDFGTFAALRFVEGFAYYMTPVAITTMAADIFPPRQRGRAMSLYSMSSGVGQLVGPLLAGAFIEASSYFLYFIFCGAFVAVSAGIILLMVRETRPQEAIASIGAGRGLALRGLSSNIRGLGVVFGIFLAATLIYRTGTTMYNPFFSLYLSEEIGLDMRETSYFFAVRALVTLAIAPLAGSLADRYGRKPTYLFGLGALIATMIGYRNVTTFEQVLAVRAMESASNAILQPSSRAYVADLLSPENRGFGMGFYMTVMDESSTMGAILGGFMAELYGFSALFLVGAATAAACLIIVLLLVQEPGRLPHHEGSPIEAEDKGPRG